MPTFLGLDAGATRTRALLVDERETVHFQGEAGPGSLLNDPGAEAQWEAATIGCPAPDAVFGGFAGLVGSERRERAHAWLRRRFPGARVRVGPDVEALPAAAPGFDVVVLAGTGSGVCSGEGEAFARSGGGGPLLGDPGSAFDLARRAAWLALFSARGGPGPLRETLLAEAIDPDPRAFAALASEPGGVARLAALARSVANCAAADPLAAEAV
jgi:N-acetylglucosamine kinase-like BadF-type ATPase